MSRVGCLTTLPCPALMVEGHRHRGRLTAGPIGSLLDAIFNAGSLLDAISNAQTTTTTAVQLNIINNLLCCDPYYCRNLFSSSACWLLLNYRLLFSVPSFHAIVVHFSTSLELFPCQSCWPSSSRHWLSLLRLCRFSRLCSSHGT